MRYSAFKALHNFSNLEVRLGTTTLIPYSTMIFTKLSVYAICNLPHGGKPQRWGSCVDLTHPEDGGSGTGPELQSSTLDLFLLFA